MASLAPALLKNRVPVPLRNREVFSARGEISLRALLFGMDPGAQTHFNWSLTPMRNAPASARELAERLASIGDCWGIRNFYAPVPGDFNGLVVEEKDFPQMQLLSDTVLMHHGVNADGVVLSHGSGFWLSTGGCPIVLATDGATAVVAHAGLKSLIRWDEKDKDHLSVVKAVAKRFRRRDRTMAWVLFSIPQEAYEHSVTNERHKKESRRILARLREVGCGAAIGENGTIDLPMLIRLQFAREGITCFANEDAYQPKEAYHTRMKGPHQNSRNLVAVIRT